MQTEDEKECNLHYHNLMNMPLEPRTSTFLMGLLKEKNVPTKIQCELIKRADLKDIKGGIENLSCKPLILKTIYKKLSRNKQALLEFLFVKINTLFIKRKFILAFRYYYKKGILELNDFPLIFYKAKISGFNYSIIIRMFQTLRVYDAQTLASRLLPPFQLINERDFHILIKGLDKLTSTKKNKIIETMAVGLSPEKLKKFNSRILSVLKKKHKKNPPLRYSEYKGTLFNPSYG